MKSCLYQLVDDPAASSGRAGFMEIAPDGEAFRLAWTLPDDAGEVRHYRGVGFRLADRFFAARSRLEGQAEPLAGVVVYAATVLGRLPARWYHVDLAGRLGHGLSVDGPTDRLEGVYGAEYGSTTEQFDPLVKRIVRTGEGYLFRWSDAAGKDVYTGIGYLLDEQLVCGWAVPGVDVEVLSYAIDGGGRLEGRGLRMQRPECFRPEAFVPKGPA